MDKMGPTNKRCTCTSFKRRFELDIRTHTSLAELVEEHCLCDVGVKISHVERSTAIRWSLAHLPSWSLSREFGHKSSQMFLVFYGFLFHNNCGLRAKLVATDCHRSLKDDASWETARYRKLRTGNFWWDSKYRGRRQGNPLLDNHLSD